MRNYFNDAPFGLNNPLKGAAVIGAQTVNRRYPNLTHFTIGNNAEVQELIVEGVRDRVLM